MTAEYLHSSVRTNIIDRSFVTQTAQGLTALYAAMLAEQGPDNSIVELNSPDEFLFNFGEPNLANYGQTGFNVIEWLRAGGKAFVTRVLPDTATFANVILNVNLTDTDASGVSPLVITPSFTTSSSNNASEAALDALVADSTIALASSGTTVPVAVFYPKGRGKWYSYKNTNTDRNNFGVKLQVVNTYDRTFNFRTYELSFTNRDDNGNDVVVEGPFLVSFDKFAKNKSRESVFIADVINKYSRFFSVKVNSTNIDALLATILTYMPTATNPLHVDFIFGKERKIGQNTYSKIHSLNTVTNILVTGAGNYSSTPTITISGGGGSGATATAVLSGTDLASVTVVDNGSGYTYTPNVTISTGVANGSAVAVIAPRINWSVAGITTAAPGVTATATVTVTSGEVVSAAVVLGGGVYTSTPTVTVVDSDVGSETAATVVASINAAGAVTALAVVSGGANYTQATTTITISAPSVITGSATAAQMLGNGSNGSFNSNTEELLLAAAYNGETVTNILDVKQYPIDMVLDANYVPSVKTAIANFITQRGDCLGILDCNFQANVAQTVDQRSSNSGLQVSDFRLAIFGQDFIIRDTYNGQDIKVTTPYFLAKKIPQIDILRGIQYPFVGPVDGVISGFEKINFIPNEPEKETLYTSQINYVEKDPKRYNFGSQLTSQVQNSALSDINNVRALLRMKREVEALMNEKRFSFNDQITLDAANYDLNQYLQKWKSNRTCQSISGTVYRSDYDRQQKIARVKIELVFTGIIERIFVDIIVNR